MRTSPHERKAAFWIAVISGVIILVMVLYGSL
jgi:hypothetical protein